MASTRGGFRARAGRPRKGRALSFRADEKTHAEIAHFAAARELSPSEWLRAFVERALAWERSRASLASSTQSS